MELSNRNLREERLHHGWSQQELADKLGVTVVTVKRWERGTQIPRESLRLKIYSLFKKSNEDLISLNKVHASSEYQRDTHMNLDHYANIIKNLEKEVKDKDEEIRYLRYQNSLLLRNIDSDLLASEDA